MFTKFWYRNSEIWLNIEVNVCKTRVFNFNILIVISDQFVYIIDESGIPLLYLDNPLKTKSTKITPDMPEEFLFSGLVTAIMSFLEEMNQGKLKGFQTEKSNIFIYKLKTFSVIVVTDLNANIRVEELTELLKQLSLEVSFKLNSVPNQQEVWIVDESELKDLEDRIVQLLTEWSTKKNEDPAVKKVRDSLW